MPALFDGESTQKSDNPLYFDCLSDFDEWTLTSKRSLLADEPIRFHPRGKTKISNQDTHGKLLVCHDYKGGYTEGPSSLSYTYNFWNYCDTFIYFSHRRITIPPPGWINAAHRQGTRILGVLIFEHKESAEDCLRLLLGKVPTSKSASHPNYSRGLPVSSYYARRLAELAHERGFDGYLLNFEYLLEGRSEQVRALESWVSLLNVELKSKIGDYAQTIWYDSIIPTGEVYWQNALNGLNLQFFLSSDSIFTNYFWSPDIPPFSAEYLLNIEPQTLQGREKNLCDIFFGVDVWGRGSHGGGGFGLFKAIEHIDPESLGLSLALFGPGWTWENDEGAEHWNWEYWWARERTLWVGPSDEGTSVDVPDFAPRKGEPPCEHGVFKPISKFFTGMPPPNPDSLPFHSSFCPGVGYSWFVEGRQVLHKPNGWTDIDKQTSIGDLVWPRPNIFWEDEELDETLPKASSELSFDDAFNSGSSLKISLVNENLYDESTFRCYWLPIQSIALTAGKLYEVTLVYKSHTVDVETDLALSVKCASEDLKIDIQPVTDGQSGDIGSNWNKLTITCKIPTNSGPDVLANVGIIAGVAYDESLTPSTLDIRLGQLNIVSKPSHNNIAHIKTSLLWADCAISESSPNILSLNWDHCISFAEPAILQRVHLDQRNNRPPWLLDQSKNWMPQLLYANLYVEARSEKTRRVPSDSAIFVGTSGFDSGKPYGGSTKVFHLDREKLPLGLRTCPLRIYVQGVTDRGLVLSWDSCTYVDLS